MLRTPTGTKGREGTSIPLSAPKLRLDMHPQAGAYCGCRPVSETGLQPQYAPAWGCMSRRNFGAESGMDVPSRPFVPVGVRSIAQDGVSLHPPPAGMYRGGLLPQYSIDRACKRRRMGVDIVPAYAAELSTERTAGTAKAWSTCRAISGCGGTSVSYTHLRAHETVLDLV